MDMNFYNNQPINNGYGIMPNQQYNPYTNVGYGYQAAQKQPKMNQLLTPEEIKKLRQTAPGFSLQITPEEALKAKCTHKENGQWTLVPEADGSHTCTICKENFNLVPYEKEHVEQVVKEMNDLIQTVKSVFYDFPERGADYFNIMPLINKLPGLLKAATDSFDQYNNIGSLAPQYGGMGQPNQGILNPLGAGMGMMGGYNPYPNTYGMGMQQPAPFGGTPMPYQQSMMDMGMQQPNPFGSLAPQMPMPQNNGFAQQPVQNPFFPQQQMPTPVYNQPQVQQPVQQPVPAQQPVADAATQAPTVVNEKTFNI